jgi:hypothetical protein
MGVLLLMIVLELALVFPLGVAVFALFRWRGGRRMAAVLPVVGVLGALLLFDSANQGHDLTEGGMLTIIAICYAL